MTWSCIFQPHDLVRHFPGPACSVAPSFHIVTEAREMSYRLFTLVVMSVRGTPELSAAPDEHVVRRWDGIPAVDGAVEAGADVACLCAAHPRILRYLPIRSQHQGNYTRPMRSHMGSKLE